MKSRMFLLVLTIGVMLGCATTYQPMGFTGGYEETRLDENVFSVFFAGNGFTGRQRAQDFAFLRAAELTLNHGYEYFVIVQSDTSIATSTYTTPGYSQTTGNIQFYRHSAYGSARTTYYGGQTYNINKPRVSLVIMCFKEKPETDATVFNAKYLKESVSQKYESELQY